MTTQDKRRSDASKQTNELPDYACIVCFKNIHIISVGECDHPICYECSARMRVLCGQNECAICRKNLSEVIFSKKRLCYRDLQKLQSDFYNRRFQIRFTDRDTEGAFNKLLQHACPKCKERPFSTFDELANHVRLQHGLFYCDMCTKHVKIFSFERRCYNRKEHAMHRRNGDPDNKSYKGHPSCEFCDERYFDEHELFRHSRMDHFYCHICDMDGLNLFYGDTNSLRKHFKDEHYICEEEDCSKEVLTNVFRSEIDLKAHTARVHSQVLGKRLTKQARTLQVDINLEPRTRPNIQDHIGGNYIEPQPTRLTNTFHDSSRIIDAKNEQEFPSLSGMSGAGASMPLVCSSLPMRSKLTTVSNLAKTAENFPSLGGNGTTAVSNDRMLNGTRQNQMSVSTLLKKSSKKPTNNSHNDTPSQGASTSSNGNQKQKNSKMFSSKNDFPALPGGTKNKHSVISSDEDYIPPPNYMNLHAISAKHRPLIDDYVSASQSSSKINVLSQSETKKKGVASDPVPQLNSSDFPQLSIQSHFPEAKWVKSQKQQEKENRKSKIAPVPDFNSFPNFSTKDVSKNTRENAGMEQVKANNQKSKKEKKENSNGKLSSDSKKQDKNSTNPKKETKIKQKDSVNTNGEKKNKQRNLKDKTTETIVNENQGNHSANDDENDFRIRNNNDCTYQNNSTTWDSSNPRSEINDNLVVCPPPGFEFKSKGSRSASEQFVNNLSNLQYLPPPNSKKRNEELDLHFQSALNNSKAYEEFGKISRCFQEGYYKAAPYYEHCKAVLKDKFDEIFPELLVLLPDVKKQQELFQIHLEYSKAFSKKKGINSRSKLDMCSICKQVVLGSDMKPHMDLHELHLKFPVLSK